MQVPTDASDAEQPLDLRRARGERKPLAPLHGALVSGKDDSQACGVDELDLVEVEHDDLGGTDRVAFQLARKAWSAEQVEFATERKHDPVVLLPDLDGELLPHNHKH